MENITDKQSVYRYSEIQLLVEEPALLISGSAGSGKTEKLCWIMASHCHQGHVVWLIDPFAPASRYKGLRVFGRNLNYSEAALGLREFVEEVGLRTHSTFHELHIHLAIDELNNLAPQISQHDETIMQEFWAIDFQSLKSLNMSVSIVYPERIYSLMRWRDKKTPNIDLTQLCCQAKFDPIVKHRKCAGWAEIIKENERKLVTQIDIPDWMIAPPDYNYEAIALCNS